MIAQTQFSAEALRSAIHARFGMTLDLADVRALANDAAQLSGSAPALAMADDVGPYYYNAVFVSMDHTPMNSPMFAIVKMSTRINYGSDLLALNTTIKELTGYKDLVITSYTELVGPTRPGHVIPTVAFA